MKSGRKVKHEQSEWQLDSAQNALILSAQHSNFISLPEWNIVAENPPIEPGQLFKELTQHEYQ